MMNSVIPISTGSTTSGGVPELADCSADTKNAIRNIAKSVKGATPFSSSTGNIESRGISPCAAPYSCIYVPYNEIANTKENRIYDVIVFRLIANFNSSNMMANTPLNKLTMMTTCKF